MIAAWELNTNMNARRLFEKHTTGLHNQLYIFDTAEFDFHVSAFVVAAIVHRHHR